MRNDKQKASPQKSRLARAWRKNCHQLQIDYAGAGGSALGAAGEGQPALGSVKTTRSKQLNVREEAIWLLCPLKYVQKCGDETCACERLDPSKQGCKKLHEFVVQVLEQSGVVTVICHAAAVDLTRR